MSLLFTDYPEMCLKLENILREAPERLKVALCVYIPLFEHMGKFLCVKAMLQSPSSPVGLREGVGRTVLCTKELCSTLHATFIVDKFTTCVSPQSESGGLVLWRGLS